MEELRNAIDTIEGKAEKLENYEDFTEVLDLLERLKEIFSIE